MEKNQIIAVVSVAILLVGAVGLIILKDNIAKNAVIDASSDYLSDNNQTINTAEMVFSELTIASNTNDVGPYILSVRSAEQYALGHIPTAVNVPLDIVFEQENLDRLPSDRKIVVVDNDGYNASRVATLLSLSGYRSVPMKYGMSAWTTNTTVAPMQLSGLEEIHNYPVIVGTEPGTMADATFPMTDAEILLEASRDYFAKGLKFISASSLYARLNDTNASNDPYVLDIRSKDTYDSGHINGSVNQNIRTMFTLENLSTLPTDNDIAVICYTGQSSGQATALLNVLGYDAYSVSYGMGSWNTSVATYTFNASVHQNSFSTINACGCENPGGIKGTYKGTNYPQESREWDVIRQAAYNYASIATFTMTSTDLNTLKTDMDSTNDPYIYDARLFYDYQLIKIPDSSTFGNKNIFDADTRGAFPSSKLIVVYCYTGQNSAQISALLNINGYNAISLRYGISSWTDDPIADLGGKAYKADVHGNDYPVVMTA